MFRLHMKLITLFSISTVFIATLYAQEAAPNPVPSPNPATRALQERRGTNPPVVTPAAENITPEMREKLRASQEKFRDEQKKLMEKLNSARIELNTAIQAETLDEKTIREKAAVVGQIEADQAVLRAKQYQEMRPYLPKRNDALKPSTNVVSNAVNKKATKPTATATNRANIKTIKPGAAGALPPPK